MSRTGTGLVIIAAGLLYVAAVWTAPDWVFRRRVSPYSSRTQHSWADHAVALAGGAAAVAFGVKKLFEDGPG